MMKSSMTQNNQPEYVGWTTLNKRLEMGRMTKIEYVTDQEIEIMNQATVEILEKMGVRALSQRFLESLGS